MIDAKIYLVKSPRDIIATVSSTKLLGDELAVKKLCVLLVLCSVFAASCAFGADIWATTDMTWSEYYAGETGETSSDLKAEGLDAFSTPTTHGLGRFPLVLGVSGDNGTTLSGMKAVQVRMSEDVYNALTDKTRFTLSTSSFREYKPVNADGSFGAMVGEKVTAGEAVVSMATGSSARWGHYVLSVKSADIDIGTTDTSKVAANYMGALLETASGKVYGLRHDNNIWSNTDVAFCVSANYTEPHGTGVQRSWQYTSDLEGETITKITYLLKDKPDVVVNTNLYVKPLGSADIEAESSDYKRDATVSVKFVVKDAEGYTLSGLSTGSGRNSKAVTGYTYEGGVLTLTNPAEGSYTATFTSEEYADVAATFKVSSWYATTDMTWAEFYAGEIGGKAADMAEEYDAVSTATTRFVSRFQGFTARTSGDGTVFEGVKAVQVRMTDAVYQTLRNDSRYTFSGDTFAEYKDVDADGTFGKMVTQSLDVNAKLSVDVALAGGTSNGHGHYRLNLSNFNYASLDLDIGASLDNFLGATLETSDGAVYGLKPLHNLWIRGNLAEQIGFSIDDFEEKNGTHLSFKHTEDMQGKTIKKITYMLKNQPDAVISCDVFVKYFCKAVASPDKAEAEAGDTVSFTFQNVPSDAGYTVSAVTPSAKGSSAVSSELYSYSDGKLTFKAGIPANSYVITFSSSNYTDITAAVYVSGWHYATTNMTYTEFFTGEIGEASAISLDAVSSATTGKAARFGVLSFDVVSEDGKSITRIGGLAGVHVRMNEELYGLLSKDSRYKASSEAFSEYKEVSADGTFGKMVTELEEVASASVALSSGASTVWGNYWLKLSGVDSIDVSGKYLGAVLETSDGKKYGLQHLYNLFFKNDEMAFCVTDFTEPHGNHPAYAHTNDLAGKTITGITYLLKDAPDKHITCSVKVPLFSEATVGVSGDKVTTGTDVTIPLTFTGIPEGVSYDLASFVFVNGRNRTPIAGYTYTGKALTISGDLAGGNYTAIFKIEGYSDIALNFYAEGNHYATTDMTWAEFYAGETGKTSADLWVDGLDAVSSPTARIANNFAQLASESNDIGGRDITGVKAVQVRMSEAVYQALSADKRYTWSVDVFAEYKDADSAGKFGKMFTEEREFDDAAITLSSGTASTWGNYTLNITHASLDTIAARENYLGALITTSEGKTYGLRHNSNLWFTAGTVALTIKEFIEPHGISRDYDYTADLEGKTITEIKYMVKNLPDVVLKSSVLLKKQASVDVSPVYPEGYHALLQGAGQAVTMSFDVPAGAEYDIVSVTPNIRHADALSPDLYTYSSSDKTLTFSPYVGAGRYKAVFGNETYIDVSTFVDVFTTDATDLIVSTDKNTAALNFLLTPRGAMDAVDAELDKNNFINATDCTSRDINRADAYDAGVQDSGFSFDIVLNGVSADYKGIVGFGKQFTMTRTTLGTENYNRVFTAINALPVGESGYREMPNLSDLSSKTGLKVVAVQAYGVSRDVTALTGAGAMIDGEDIMLFYGVMAADAASGDVEEGEYMLSPEGETLIADGVKDGHIKLAMYIAVSGVSSSPDVKPDSGDNSVPDTDSVDVTVPEVDSRDTSAPTVEAVPVRPSRPTANLESETVTGNIISLLQAIVGVLTGDTEVLALPESASGGDRSSLSSEEVAAIPAGEIPALVLPVMRVETPAVYVWGIDLTSLDVGAVIVLHMFPESDTGTAEVSASDDSGDDETGTFVDDDGNEVKTVPESKKVNAAAYMEPDKTYAPVITTSTAEPSSIGSPGGGCDAGLSVAGAAVLAFFIKRKR